MKSINLLVFSLLALAFFSSQKTFSMEDSAEKKPKHSLNFDGNNGEVYKEKNYGEKVKIIESGVLPNELHELVGALMEEICVKQTQGKMCSLYLIKNQDQIKLYIAISGAQSKNFGPFTQKINKNKKLKGRVVLAPFSEKRAEIIPSEDSKDSDILNRKQLFIKFLITTVGYYNNPKEYDILKEKFFLTEEHGKYIEIIKNLSSNDCVKTAHKNYKIDYEDVPLLHYLSQYIFEPLKIVPEQRKIIESSSFHYKITDPNTKKEISLEECAIRTARERLGNIPQEIIDELYINMEKLWNSLDPYTDFEISHLLAHCAESNLIDYFHENSQIIKEEGEHYLFNLIINKEHEFSLQELCDICCVNTDEHFSNLYETESSVFGHIPIKILGKYGTEIDSKLHIQSLPNVDKTTFCENSKPSETASSISHIVYKCTKPIHPEFGEFMQMRSLQGVNETEEEITFYIPGKYSEEFIKITTAVMYHEAYKLLIENINTIKTLLQPALKEALKNEEFTDYLNKKGITVADSNRDVTHNGIIELYLYYYIKINEDIHPAVTEALNYVYQLRGNPSK